MAAHRTPDHIRKGMVKLHQEGKTLRFIANSYKTNHTSVKKILIAEGVYNPPKQGSWSKKTWGGKADKPPKKKAIQRRKKRDSELCLKCDRPFKSEGIHNRICPNCQNSNAIIVDNYIEDYAHKSNAAAIAQHRESIELMKLGPPVPDPKAKKEQRK